MVKRSYSIGYRKENEAVKELEKQGYYVVRSAGSKGVFDLVAICADFVKLIEIKVIGFGEKKRFLQERENLGYVQCPENVFKELWVWEKYRRWHVYKVPAYKEYLKRKK